MSGRPGDTRAGAGGSGMAARPVGGPGGGGGGMGRGPGGGGMGFGHMGGMPPAKPKNLKRALGRLVGELRHERPLIVGSIALSVVAVVPALTLLLTLLREAVVHAEASRPD